MQFCQDLESAVIKTVEAGHMTKDLAICVNGASAGPSTYLNTQPFMDKIKETLEREYGYKST